MRISEAKECIKQLYLNTNSVTALISERGIGKTSAYQQCAKELSIGYIGLYAAALEGPDFMGLPDKDVKKGITRYLAPQFLPTKQAVDEGIYPDKGLLVLEEINRVPSDTISVLYPLLLEKKINGHQLAPGWQIGVTMNPDTMNYLVNALDDAMLDRFIAIEIKADLADYIEFSKLNDPNKEVLDFLEAFSDLLLVVKKSSDSTALYKAPTPRGWTKVQELLNHCQLDSHLMSELIAGIVGPQAAATFYGYLNQKDLNLPSPKQLLSNYNKVREEVNKLLATNRLDLLNELIKNVVLTFSNKDYEQMNAFVEDLPEELKILYFKYLATKRPEIMDEVIDRIKSFEQISDKLIDVLHQS